MTTIANAQSEERHDRKNIVLVMPLTRATELREVGLAISDLPQCLQVALLVRSEVSNGPLSWGDRSCQDRWHTCSCVSTWPGVRSRRPIVSYYSKFSFSCQCSNRIENRMVPTVVRPSPSRAVSMRS